MRRSLGEKLLTLTGVGALAGCTLITGASDYKVDDSAGAQGRDRDLQYSFVGMYPHAGKPLDVAIVSENKVLQARARIVLPPLPEDVLKYPVIDLDMENALTPGAQSLYFFADENGDGLVDFKDNGEGKPRGIIEHVWVEPLEDDGIGSFTHAVDFTVFDESEYSALNGDLIMKLPTLPNMPDVDLLKCLEEKVTEDIEIVLTLKASDRQVGLFRRYGKTAIPADGIRLKGILDGGSMYQIDVLVDGKVEKTFEATAPINGDLEVAPLEWFPLKLSATNC